MNVVWIILCLLIRLSVSPLTSEAGENDGDPVELKPLVVTGTVFPTSFSHKSTVGLTVLDREQIQSSQTTSVIDLLRHVPGLHIDQAGGRGSVSSVYTRGADPNFTTVLIDGVKVNDPTNNRGGSFDFSTLSTDNIERIEIVRGPYSAIYGSDAMGGVINIITRPGKGKPTVSVEAEGGRFDFARTLVRSGGSGDRWDYSISASYLDNGEPVEGSSFLSTAVTANGGWSFSDMLDFRTVLRYAESESEAFPDDSGGPLFAVLRDVDEKDSEELSFGAQLEGEPSAVWQYSANFALFHREETIASPGVTPGVRDEFGIPANSADTDFHRYVLTLNQQFQLWEASTFAIGFEGVKEKGSSRGELEFDGEPTPTRFDLDRNIIAPFFEFQYAFQFGLSLRGGARLDVPEEFDSEFSPRLGAAYTFEKTDTTVSANWGEGFKLPSFFALGNSIVGNPDLKPETSRGFDTGVTQPLWEERASVKATFFHNTFFDAIDLEETPTLRLVNRSKVVTEGVEVSFSLKPLPELLWTAHLTYLETDIRGTEEELRNRPKWRGGFSIGWHPTPTTHVRLATTHVGEVLDSSIPTGDLFLDPYNRVDLAASWNFSEHWKFLLTVDNLFDADYEEFAGFPAPGITPRIGVRWTSNARR